MANDSDDDFSTSKQLKHIRATLESIGVAESFFKDLIDRGDDWSFIVKLHSLLEAALTDLLLKDLERMELEEILANLEMSNSKTGKLAFAKQLKITTKRGRRFIKKLSELRNELVHRIKNTSFSFEYELSKDDGGKIASAAKNCVSSASEFLKEEIDIADTQVPRDTFAKENPRLMIWFGAFFVISEMYTFVSPDDPLKKALMRRFREES